MIKNLPASARDIRDTVSIPGWGRSPGEGNGYPLQYSCLDNPWTEETGELQSMGSQRVGHDWSDLAQHPILLGLIFECNFKELKVSGDQSNNFVNLRNCIGTTNVGFLKRVGLETTTWVWGPVWLPHPIPLHANGTYGKALSDSLIWSQAKKLYWDERSVESYHIDTGSRKELRSLEASRERENDSQESDE